MDNLTHTLVGMVAGDVIARSSAEATGGLSGTLRRSYVVAVAALGSNLPDIDLLLTYGGFAPGKMGYLLHHRGHTHTVIGCLLLAALLYAGARLWARFRGHHLARGDRVVIAVAALLGVLLHLGMDSLNSYGVHPWWPFDNRWFYGDAVFIIEPLYWLSVAPLIFTVRTRWARVALCLVLLLALGIGGLLHRDLPLWLACALPLVAAMLFVGRRYSARAAALTSAVAIVCVTAVFLVSGRVAARDVAAFAATNFPRESTVDHVLSPLPSNPLCWNVLLLQEAGEQYVVRQGVVAVAPSLLAAGRCPTLPLGVQVTAPYQRPRTASSASVRWQGELVMDRSRLAAIVAENCEARELMQFARAPFFIEEGHRRVLGDLRFDRETGLGFAEFELPDPPARCRFNVPWIPPRLTLLR